MYAPRAWASSEPVDITGRLNAIQGALSSVQAAANDYFAYQQQRADTLNALQARMSEYNSRIYHRRLEEEAAEREQLAALASQNRVFKMGTVNPVAGSDIQFFQEKLFENFRCGIAKNARLKRVIQLMRRNAQ
ncbi:MAG: hypothetical protein R3C13_00080 [Hyphomonas sp.]|uniref:hypothetical protein n=1 Tax=Hyphomonas sp. TaxID=87 RepID=UPI00352815DC